MMSSKSGTIRVGIGGWTFEPWRGVFYPAGLPHKRELEFASRALTAIEINGTYYSTFKPDTWRKWNDETPDDFVFTVKASRYCTNRKILADAGDAVKKFMNQGLTELGPKLGPINWQFMATKKFDPDDFSAFLTLLPKTLNGIAIRHAVEVRHPSFVDERFYALARKHKIAIVCAIDDAFPEIDQPAAGFTYARIMTSTEDVKTGLPAKDLNKIADRARSWAKIGDVFAFFISSAKVRNPAAAQSLIRLLPK